MVGTIPVEEACKLVCYLCDEGSKPVFDEVTGRYYHVNEYGHIYNSGFCRANRIRMNERAKSPPSKPLVQPRKEDHILAHHGYYLADAYANAGDSIIWTIKWPFRALAEIWRRLVA